MPTAMRRLSALALCLFAVSFAGPAAADTRTAEVYINMTGPELQQLLLSWGYRAELTQASDGDPLVRSSVNGINFVAMLYGCDQQQPRRCNSMDLVTSFTLRQPITLAQVNDWNSRYRFASAYLRDNDPHLLTVINIDGGITAASLRDWMGEWDFHTNAFMDFIGFE